MNVVDIAPLKIGVNEQVCANCEFFFNLNQCRRHAPQVFQRRHRVDVHGNPTYALDTVWPHVQPTDWCGDFDWRTRS